uniref:Uncharacterized protein n=1 Tax=mine drainage metagenome TaxID=410659 RepID=E6QE38_9ZZZZ
MIPSSYQLWYFFEILTPNENHIQSELMLISLGLQQESLL